MVVTRVVLLVLLSTVWSYGQKAYYLCYFSDKPTFELSTVKPSDYLSEASITRRQKNGVAFSEEDYPVHQPYLDSVKTNEATVKVVSKWFNAALVLAEETQKTSLEVKPFVDSLVLVSRLLEGSNSNKEKPTRVAGSTTVGNHFLKEESLTDYFNRGEGVKIAVFDGGFQEVNQHEEFKHLFEEGRIRGVDLLANGSDVYQYNDHGTEVLSILAAEGGVAPQANYELYVTEDVTIETRVEEVYWLRAAEMADSSGVDIINSSLGYSLFHDLAEEDYQLADLDGKTSIITRAANFATSKGIVVVSSVGNEGKESGWNKMNMPSDAFDVITVGGVGRNGMRADFSSLGPTADNRIKPEIMALGVAVKVLNKNGWTTAGGTSFSAPAISGVCALLLQKDPTLTREKIKQLIIQSGNRMGEPDNEYGYGVLDFELLMGKGASITDKPMFYFSADGQQINFLNAAKKALTIGLYNFGGKVFYQGSSSEAIITLDYPKNIPFLILKVISEDSSSTFVLPNIE